MFETQQIAQPQFQGMDSLITGTSPLSVLGKAMGELDASLNRRVSEDYLKSLTPDTFDSLDTLAQAKLSAPNKVAEDAIQSRIDLKIATDKANQEKMANIAELALKQAQTQQTQALAGKTGAETTSIAQEIGYKAEDRPTTVATDTAKLQGLVADNQTKLFDLEQKIKMAPDEITKLQLSNQKAMLENTGAQLQNQLAEATQQDKIIQEKEKAKQSVITTEQMPKELQMKLDESKARIGQIQAQTKETIANIDKINLEAEKKKQELIYGSATEMSATAEKKMSDSIDASLKASQEADSWEKVGNGYASLDPNAGAMAKGWDYAKKITGNDDAINLLRNDYERVKNLSALGLLPPGVASDKDIELVMGAFPDKNSNPQTIIAFAQAMSRIKKAEVKYHDVRAEWISRNGSEAISKREMTIGNKIVKPGQSLPQFLKSMKIIGRKQGKDGKVIVQFADGTYGVE